MRFEGLRLLQKHRDVDSDYDTDSSARQDARHSTEAAATSCIVLRMPAVESTLRVGWGNGRFRFDISVRRGEQHPATVACDPRGNVGMRGRVQYSDLDALVAAVVSWTE